MSNVQTKILNASKHSLFALVNNESFYNFFIIRFSELIFILYPRNKLSHNSDTKCW